MLKLCSYVRFKVPQQVRSPGWLQRPGKGGLGGGEQVCFSPSVRAGSRGSARSGGGTAIASVTQAGHPRLRFQHLPSTFPSNPSFPTSLWQDPLKFLLPARSLGAGWDVERFFSKYGWQEALSN